MVAQKLPEDIVLGRDCVNSAEVRGQRLSHATYWRILWAEDQSLGSMLSVLWHGNNRMSQGGTLG